MHNPLSKQSRKQKNSHRFLLFVVSILAGILSFSGCRSAPEAISSRPESFTITLIIEGDSQTVSSGAATVRQLLDEYNVSLGELDEVDPPGFTPVSQNLTITVTRLSESFEAIQQTVPFERRFVRSESMSETDEPVIVQAGQDGLQETTWRIVYRDGLEAERWPTNSVVIREPTEEIVMVGIGSIGGNVSFTGLIAYISDNTPVLLRGGSSFPVQLRSNGRLDGRVFKLSPSGSHLLYSEANEEESGQLNNSLWVISTAPNSQPRRLSVDNVLWADWNPAKTELMEIAYSTARPTDAPPGWEANNDLWRGDVLRSETAVFNPEQIIEAYPATYGWWGGNYAWSPNGSFLAYSFADEVGVINMIAEQGSHIQLQSFTEYNTLSNWVWVPSLSWSPDSQYLAFTNHGGDDNRAMQFDSWVVNVFNGVGGKFVSQSGMWGHMHWVANESTPLENGRITYLKTNDPIDSQRSTYTLWVMDEDGSNGRQLFPTVGENSDFPRYSQFLSWGPTGEQLSFVFNDQLYLYTVETNDAERLTQDDAVVSHPTWAPYGAGLNAPTPVATPTPTTDFSDDLLPEEDE